MTWQGGTSPGFPPAVRAQILRRDPICRCTGCRNCTTTGCTHPSTEADHIIAWANGGTHHLSNGRGLCKWCHQVRTAQQARDGIARMPKAQRKAEQHPGIRPI